MAVLNSLERFTLYFQGGVRRSIIIFAAICLILLVPFYFTGQYISNLWFNSPYNPNSPQSQSIVNKKNLVINSFIISKTETRPLANNENNLYLTLNNKNNQEIGFYPLVYRLQILDKDNSIVSEKTYSTYLLPGDVKYVIAYSPSLTGQNLNLITENAKTQAVNYNPTANNILKQPNLEIRQEQITTSTDSKDLTISFTIKNNDQVSIKEVNILYIIRDTRQDVAGIGNFLARNLDAESEQPISFSFPKPKFGIVNNTPEIRWSVNYLDPTNIILR